MDEKIIIPYNDVFFYGLSLRSRDISDVRGDIFSNIFMKYLRSLKPVSNRLYRTADNAKYEYSYTFAPTKPLNWRVIKNRRIIEDIEYLSDGKYCLNYYDDNGNDVKRVIYSNQHKWLKTNYYNSIYGSNLLCSLVPKELNGQTVIMQYITGEAYPVTLYCCPVPTSSDVLNKVLDRVPEPEVLALTNYGLLYFACEETYNIYKQVLSEEEKKYADARKPAVYNTQEDVENGFCFDVNSFDLTKSIESAFDLSSVEELTEDGFPTSQLSEAYVAQTELDTENSILEEYSIDKEIADAIRIISEETNISIDEDFVLSQVTDDRQDQPEAIPEFENKPELAVVNHIDAIPEELNHNEEVAIIENEGILSTIDIDADISISSDDINLLVMDDEAIDDYVSTLIDSILKDAHNTASEYMIDKEEVFTQAESEAVSGDVAVIASGASDYVEENVSDIVIESNGASYYYYGETVDNKRNGRGRTLMSDGKTAYEGEYKNDMRHGIGSFYYKNGSLCYWGQWQENLRNGFGMGVSSETGVTHIGEWKQNKPEGIGVRFDKDGNFMYLDSASHRTNGGIRVTGFTDNSLFIEIWDKKTLKIIKKEIIINDLLN